MDNRGTTREEQSPEGLNDKTFMEETTMKDFDFGYFGTGDEGYAQYMTAFERNFSTDSTDSFASDDADYDADSSDSTEDDF